MKRYFAIVCFSFCLFMSNAIGQTNSNQDSGTVIQGFTLLRAAASVKIVWQTSAEKNNNFFEIQRSTDGVEFSILALVFAREGATNGADYQYIDTHPAQAGSDFVYYRIKQVDLQQQSQLTMARKFRIADQRNVSE